MKRLIKILFYFICSLVLVLALAMAFIEFRLLISGDWLIYDSAFNAFIRYLLRFLISCFYIFVMMCEFIKKSRNMEFINKHLYLFEIMLLMFSIILLIFATNYIGLVVFCMTLLFVLLKTYVLKKIDSCEIK